MLTVSTWSLSESFTAADTIPSSNSNITAGTVPNFGSVISTVAGSGDGFAWFYHICSRDHRT